MGEPQIISEQVPKRVESDVEQRVLLTQSGCINRAKFPGARTLPGLLQNLNRKQFKIGVPQLKVKFDSTGNVRIVVVAFPFPAGFLDQRRQMIGRQFPS